MQWFFPGDPKPPPLPDREVLNAVVFADDGAIGQGNLTLARWQKGVEEGMHRAVVISKTEVLAFRLLRSAQPVSGGLQACVRLGQFPQREHDLPQHGLG